MKKQILSCCSTCAWPCGDGVKCKCAVTSDVHETLGSGDQKRVQQEDTLGAGLAKYQKSGEYSDLTIVCGHAKFPVHRVIVCSQSGFFKTACKEGFKEGNTAVVELHEEPEELVQAMIEYLYTAKYVCPHLEIIMSQLGYCDHPDLVCSFNLSNCSLKPFGIAIALHTLGDKYDIPGLRNHSCAYLEGLFKRIIFDDWEQDVTVWKMAYEHSRHSDGLRKVVFNRIRAELCGKARSDLLNDPDFKVFLQQSPELGVPLLIEELKLP